MMYFFCVVPAILCERKSTSNLVSLVCRSASELVIAFCRSVIRGTSVMYRKIFLVFSQHFQQRWFSRPSFYCLWNCGVLPLAKFIVEVLCPDDENLQLLSILFAIVLLFLPRVRSFADVCVEKLTMSRLQNIESALILVHRLTSYVKVFSTTASHSIICTTLKRKAR